MCVCVQTILVAFSLSPMASADSGAALAASTLADPAPASAVAASSLLQAAVAAAAASDGYCAPASSSSAAPSAAASAASSASASSDAHTAAARSLHAIATALSPTIYFHAHERFLPCSIEHLLTGGLLRDESGQYPSIPDPTQEDLRREFDGRFILEIDPRQHGGQPLEEAPLYYAHQILPHSAAAAAASSPHPASPLPQQPQQEEEITYIVLCGFNGAQPFHTRSGGHFTLADFATHPGDIERITVRFVRETEQAAAAASQGAAASSESLVPKLRVIGATFEAHGDASYFPAHQLQFSSQSPLSVMAHCALGSHATYNFKSHSLGDWIVLAKIAGSATAGDALGVCGCTAPSAELKVWQASSQQLRFVGLDSQGEPIGREVWAKFRGRIGGHVTTRLRDGRRFDGAGLPGGLWFRLKTLHWFANMAGKIQKEMTQGDGPHGLGNRKYIRPMQGQRTHHEHYHHHQHAHQQRHRQAQTHAAASASSSSSSSQLHGAH